MQIMLKLHRVRFLVKDTMIKVGLIRAEFRYGIQGGFELTYAAMSRGKIFLDELQESHVTMNLKDFYGKF